MLAHIASLPRAARRGLENLGGKSGAKNRQVHRAEATHNQDMNETRIALITGANKGIGLQIAKELANHGLAILIGSRDLERGRAAAKEVGRGARAVQLDVTSSPSITAAAEWIRKECGRLDVLVNNAGISNSPAPEASFEDLLAMARPSVVPLDEVRVVFETNVFGVLAVTQALLPLLREASAGRIVNVSSEVGSLARQGDPNNPYRMANGSYSPSKTALNALTVAFANELDGSRIKVNSVCPGFTATDLNRFRGSRTVEQGARAAVHCAMLDETGPSGGFFDEAGPLPW